MHGSNVSHRFMVLDRWAIITHTQGGKMETISYDAWLKRFAPLQGFGSLGYHHTYRGWDDGNYLLQCMAQTFRTASWFWIVGLSSHIQRVGRWKLSLTMHGSNVSHRSKVLGRWAIITHTEGGMMETISCNAWLNVSHRFMVLDRWAIITHTEGGMMETISYNAWLKRFAPLQGFGSLGYHHTYRG
ncbi:hypothetical protein RRG08_052812 [Elysia crispata]|uniref:Uncharacterized protein n=1 Tax=Elysia crispata TaxID=231223 RepID=A0AAE1EAH5_9GAST|nr:hypothetical protein RRG08_052812 [Elysia crispata]